MTLHDLSRQALSLKERNWPLCPLPPLIFITDSGRIPNPTSIIPKLPIGTLVIIRDYNHPDRKQYVHTVAQACHHFHIPFLIAGADTELATQTKASGIHLPEYENHQATSIRTHFPNWWVTSSIHSEKNIPLTNTLPLDAILISPVFSTPSHPDALPLGISTIDRLTKLSIHPAYALGGITTKTSPHLLQSKLCGLACIGAFSAT
jgi:thiamine-phosphate pyrophosphorylase